MSLLRSLRALVLGETWTLPLGVTIAIGGAALLRISDAGWWHSAGGWVLLAGLAVALASSLRREV